MNIAGLIRQEYASTKPMAYKMLSEPEFVDSSEDEDRIESVQAGIASLISEDILLYAFRETPKTVASVESLCEQAESIIKNKVAVNELALLYAERNSDFIPPDVPINFDELNDQLNYSLKRIIHLLLDDSVQDDELDFMEPSDEDLLKIQAVELDDSTTRLLKDIFRKKAA